ncbi:MAG: hypothetical protein MUP04_09270 [Anaerolineae bacterium]|nr:hypothetical protein [Anaerolineae bacterium]
MSREKRNDGTLWGGVQVEARRVIKRAIATSGRWPRAKMEERHPCCVYLSDGSGHLLVTASLYVKA